MKLLDVLKKYDRCVVRESIKLNKIYNALIKESEEIDDIEEAEVCPDCGEAKCVCENDDEVEEAEEMMTAEEFFAEADEDDVDEADETVSAEEFFAEADEDIEESEDDVEESDDEVEEAEDKVEESEDEKNIDEEADEDDIDESEDVSEDDETIEESDDEIDEEEEEKKLEESLKNYRRKNARLFN